ncbi:MAG TPA: GNAT family N-acetyltransferase [Candidatus Thermoplasmatota archaeon]|nr:GNAT family N-acetyltransferase [Candidatus Thermoplasmatota archaeon]
MSGASLRGAMPASARADRPSARPPPAVVQVRAARPADLDALVVSTLGNALESEGIRLDPPTARRGVASLLEDPHKGRVFVAEAGGKVVASTYITFEWSDWHAAWYWWIQSVYVQPEWRGKHVYTALYRAIQEAARQEKDVRAVRLYVEAHNKPALRAYHGHGMKKAPYEVFEWVVEPA